MFPQQTPATGFQNRARPLVFNQSNKTAVLTPPLGKNLKMPSAYNFSERQRFYFHATDVAFIDLIGLN